MELEKQFRKETETENPMSNGFLKITYQQGYKRKDGRTDNKFLCLTAYKDGRGHYRTLKRKVFTDIGIARKASEFMRELYGACV